LEHNIRLSEGLCAGLLARCAESKFLEFAEEIIKYVRQHNNMSIALYSALMKVYAFCGMFHEACGLYDKLTKDGLEPDIPMYGCLMRFAVECGRVQFSQELAMKAPALDMQNYMALIRIAARDKDVSMAGQLLSRLKSSGHGVDIAAYTCALDVYVCAADMQRACELVEEMKRVYKLDVITYNTLMKGYCTAGDIEGAKELLASMKRDGLEPNDVTYNCLLNAAVSSGSNGCLREAWLVVDEMEENGVPVDHYTISTLMKALKKTRNPRDAAKAFSLLDRAGLDVGSEEILFNAVLETATRHRDIPRTEAVLASYNRERLKPSLHSYGTMIKACNTLKRVDQAWQLWTEMTEERGLEPNDVVLGCMLDALVCNECIFDAVEFFDRWKVRVKPNTVHYSTLIKGFANTSQSALAMKAWREMKALNIEINSVAYNALINAQARQGAMDEVSELFVAMQEDGCAPDHLTYSTIVKGFCVKGDLNKAMEVFKATRKTGLWHDSGIYNTLLDGCSRHARWDLVDQLLASMDEYEVIPSNHTLGIIARMYGRRKMLDEAFEAVERITKAHDFKANDQVLLCLMSACISNNAPDRALATFEEMKRSGHCADVKVYSALVGAYVRCGYLGKAGSLVEEAFGLDSEEDSGAEQPPGVHLEIVQSLMRAYAKKGKMKSKGEPLLEALAKAKAPISPRLSSDCFGAVPEVKGHGKNGAKRTPPKQRGGQKNQKDQNHQHSYQQYEVISNTYYSCGGW